MKRLLLLPVLAAASFTTVSAADRPQPLKVLLVAGGCCHDYAKQKDILKEGIEKRVNAKVDIAYSDDKSTKPPLPILGNADYAKGYDVVIHDECAADVKDPAIVEAVLKPHKDGIPGVNLHCAMHCYRVAPDFQKKQDAGSPGAAWFEYLGLQSTGHGAQEPIALTYVDKDSPISKGLSDWTTIKEELYNNVQIFPTAHPLLKGKQTVKTKQKQADGTEVQGEKTSETVVAWTNTYGKTRVFSTTIGHNNQTVEDDRYLDLVTHGLLWACDKLDENGQPKAGYGPAGK